MNTIFKIINGIVSAIKITFGLILPIAAIIAILSGIGYLGFSVWGFWGIAAVLAAAGIFTGVMLSLNNPFSNYCQWWLLNRNR